MSELAPESRGRGDPGAAPARVGRTPPPVPPGLRAGGRYAAWEPLGPVHVACDVDGTLIGPDPLPTEAVRDGVAAARAVGLSVGLATGRGHRAIGPLLASIDADGPHVLHNGAQVRAEGRVIAAWDLTTEDVGALLELAATRDDLDVELYTDAGLWTARMDERSRPHWDLIGEDPLGRATAASDLDGPAVKATLVLYDPTRRDEVTTAVAALGLSAGPAGSPRTPGLMYVNATRPGIGKQAGLAAVAQHLGIDPRAIAAIGDEANDLAMLAMAGTAIAMGQADAEVVAVAHLVAPAVTADGAAVALRAIAGLAGGRSQRAPGT